MPAIDRSASGLIFETWLVASTETVAALNVAHAADHLGDNLHTLELNPVWVHDSHVEILDALIAVHSAGPPGS